MKKKDALGKLKKGMAMCLTSAMIASFVLPTGVQAASWQKNNTGWWWQEDDGSYPVNEWKTVKGKKYNFDEKGYMRSGWYWDGANWYYLGGANDGSAKTGWFLDGANWYYLDADGKMVTGWRNVNGCWYYMNSSGAMQTGWLWDGANWYYLGGANDGSMKTGWQYINGKWYYMDGSGKMVSSTWVGEYWVDSSGAWTKTKQPAQWVASGNRWWYRHSDGGYTTNNFETINGKKYLFDNAGWMLTGWQKVGNNWYCLDGSGAMVSSQWVGDYYLGADGVMVTNQWVGNYYVGADGAWVRDKQPEHAHKWVAETKLINHPEESHQELVKDAWTETIDHDAEYKKVVDKEAWTETINHPEEGHYEVEEDGYWTLKVSASEDGKEYSCERIFVELDTKICDENGMDVEVPVFEQKYRNICNGCGADITGNEHDHNVNHMLNGEKGGWHSEYRTYQTGTKTEHYDAYWVVDKEAWTETINHPEESHQELVKEAWTETINHDAEYKKVVDKEAWTETVTAYKCSCGATK